MAALFRRNTLIYKYNQLKQLHKSVDGVVSLPTSKVYLEKKAFEAIFPDVTNTIVRSLNLNSLPEIRSWVKQMLDYTMAGATLGSGLSVPIGYRMLEAPEHYSEKTQNLARVLGWCVEMVLDDIVDGSTVRHGKPCWHLQPHVGLFAVNDSILIQQSMMELLEINFGKTSNFNDLMRLFNEAVYKTTVGQHLDCMLTYNREKDNIDVLTMNNHNIITIHKTSYCASRLPILLALLLIKNGKQKATKELNDICFDFGLLLQCEDDYIDAYGDETIAGKVTRDIQEGKCSWVAATALQRCNNEQRTVFKEYYGSEDQEHVKQIKRLYDELDIPQVYEQYVGNMYSDLVRRIHALPTKEETKFLLEFLDGCYR